MLWEIGDWQVLGLLIHTSRIGNYTDFILKSAESSFKGRECGQRSRFLHFFLRQPLGKHLLSDL
jgi:hypothetical protein